MPETITIDMTPTWSAMLPALLDARGNMKRKVEATECDGREDGWCSVHDMGYDESAVYKGCDFYALTGEKQNEWRRELSLNLSNLDIEFRKMAKGADIAVEVQTLAKHWRKDGVPDQSVMLNQVLDAIGWAD